VNAGSRPFGPLGAALLGVTAIVGVALAVHGWSHRRLPAIASVGGAPAAARTAPSAGASGSSSGPAGPQAPAPSRPAGVAPGPLLRSEQYAQYAFRVWPGRLTSQARAAMTGLKVTVRSKPGGIEVTAGVIGQAATPPVFYATGTRVYVIEAALGDDSGNSDYNLGDDGLVVTDAHDRIVR